MCVHLVRICMKILRIRFFWVKNIAVICMDKIQVFIFVPTSSCSCTYEKFMDRVFRTIRDYNDYLYVDTKDSDSPLANSFNIVQKSIVVINPPNQEGPLIYTDVFRFKDFLENPYIPI